MNKKCIVTAVVGWLFLTIFWGRAAEFRFQVKHDHGWKSCRGELLFSENAVFFTTNRSEHSRTWNYRDIQQIGLLSADRITVLTYEDRKWLLGKDRRFRFEVTEGKVDGSLWAFLQGKVTRPVVSDVLPGDFPFRFKLPVKHQRRITGSEGFLEIADRYVVYRTGVKGDSRIWSYEDIDSIGSTGPYQLRITVREQVHNEVGGDKNYIFQLKEKMDAAIYDFVWWRINGSKISSNP